MKTNRYRGNRSLSIEELLARAQHPTLESAFASVLQEFDPGSRKTVTEVALESTRIGSGAGGSASKWSLEKTPYIQEPQDILASLDYSGMVFVGPSRTGKSIMLLNWVGHTVMVDPEDMLLVHNDMPNARKWSKGEFNRFLRSSPDIRNRQMTARQYDNTFDKQFKSGMQINIASPTPSNLSAITVAKVGFMDYDRNSDDATEGSNPFDLGSVRTRTKGRKGMTAAESSPNPEKQMSDPKWRPETPHDAPPSPGIFELYNRGDRRLFMWQCPYDDCKQWFEGGFDLLAGWQGIDDVADAAAAVYMACPCCGQHIPPSMQQQLNAKGRWVPKGGMIDPAGNLVPIPGQKIRKSKIASFWLKGTAAGYSTWNDLVSWYMQAEQAYEDTGDEAPLRKTITTDQGMYYVSKALTSDRNPEDLKAKAEDWGSTSENPTVPPWVRFLVACVDVQKEGFVVQVTGFGPSGDATVIDHFKITSSLRLNSEGENLPVKPHAFAEDWDMMKSRVAGISYELGDGSGRRMRIKFSTVDGYGLEGVTTQAYRFWQRLQKDGEGLHRKFAIIKGEPRANAPFAQTTTTEVGVGVKAPMVRGAIPRVHFSSKLIKDTVANLMARRVLTEVGEEGGMLRYPSWTPEWFYRQMTNEIRNSKGWVKIGSRRNESFDLTSYAVGITQRPVEKTSPFDTIQVHRTDWDNPPEWAAPWDENSLVFSPDVAPDDESLPLSKRAMRSWADLAKKMG